MGAREKFMGIVRDSVTDTTAQKVFDEVRQEILEEAAEKIQREIIIARNADWGKSRGKIVYIQGLGQAKRAIWRDQ